MAGTRCPCSLENKGSVKRGRTQTWGGQVSPEEEIKVALGLDPQTHSTSEVNRGRHTRKEKVLEDPQGIERTRNETERQ